ncbi:unnamed protein product [Mytilus coruscus]|uniref:Uncharacterized protein n=1 Tax=Mytilus coruscus TaxID=42192 RepID=A0A6J8BUH9_MYTCO|nr:unnamed protein product [Mytilus coruscus]
MSQNKEVIKQSSGSVGDVQNFCIDSAEADIVIDRVCPIGDDLLLGCDMIDEKNITINTRKGLEIQGHWVDCDVLRKFDKVAKVVLKETVTVPPNSGVVLSGYGINAECLDTRFVVEDDRKILVARCMIDPYQDTVPVRLVNLESFPVKMKKNYLIGEIYPVENLQFFVNENFHLKKISEYGCCDVHFGQRFQTGRSDKNLPIPDEWKYSQVTKGKNREKANFPKLPDHLVDLYSKSCERLIETGHKLKLAEVLNKHRDAFANNKLDLGSCSLVKHKIDTTGAAPVRQPLRPNSQGFEGEEEKEDDFKSSVHYVDNLHSKLEEIYAIVRDNLKIAAECQKKDYESRLSQSSFKVGDLVFKYDNIAKKLQPR